jgi:hypothetical protein
MSTCRIFLTNYGFHSSRSHATSSQETDYVGVSEAAGLEPLRSVTLTGAQFLKYDNKRGDIDIGMSLEVVPKPTAWLGD